MGAYIPFGKSGMNTRLEHRFAKISGVTLMQLLLVLVTLRPMMRTFKMHSRSSWTPKFFKV